MCKYLSLTKIINTLFFILKYQNIFSRNTLVIKIFLTPQSFGLMWRYIPPSRTCSSSDHQSQSRYECYTSEGENTPLCSACHLQLLLRTWKWKSTLTHLKSIVKTSRSAARMKCLILFFFGILSCFTHLMIFLEFSIEKCL